ncbi:MAG: TonB-dependent receptor, partial [Candidatus Kapabacteria bacterium]|nr:TonB-dependent receptor [Candidatus Kapabacteria bacterium]
YQHLSVASNRTVFPDEPIIANIGGIYAQLEAKLTDQLSFVGSARYDNANIYPQQFSPRVAFLYKPDADQVIRLSAGRSFQRANFSELFRKYAFRPAFTAQGAPVNFRPVQGRIDSALSALSGAQQRVFMGLYDTTVTNPRDPRGIQPAAWGVGNRDLNVEQNIGIELGYNAKIGTKLYVTVDLYYNRLTNFISGFLPGVNPNFTSWSSKSQLPAELQQYASVVDSIIYSQISPQDRARFTTYQGSPSFIVSNTNIGLVEQYGLELNVMYAVTPELEVAANYAYFRANLLDAKTPNPFLATGSALLSPNTSPHRFNISATYIKQNAWDASVMLRYVEGFAWLAGDFQGYVPSYAVVNLNAGYHVTQDLRLGLVVNNLLNRRHFEIFGGSNIPRLTYLSASYQF